MSSGTRMKGQFFMIGAVFICVLLFFGISPAIQVTSPPSDDMDFLAGNLQKEIPHALNTGINSSDPLGVLYNFTEFSEDAVLGRGIDLGVLWVVFMPGAGNVNVSAGNLMDSGKTVSVNISGTCKDIYVAGGAVNSTLFTVSGYTFDAEVTADGEITKAALLSNKTSIYSVISMERGEKVVRKELLA
jgi:hypothetical protein